MSPPVGNSARVDVGAIRREQIIAATVDLIVHHGLHHVSLSKIEQAAGMKRGQLTYYFPTKEDILLAVFDRLVLLMHERIRESEGHIDPHAAGVKCWDCVQQMFRMVLHSGTPSPREFHSLQYTFLAQIAYREDFREKVSGLFETWRETVGTHWKATSRPRSGWASRVSPRTVGSLMQALVHGLGVQLDADPNAFDRGEMLETILTILMPLFAAKSAEKRR